MEKRKLLFVRRWNRIKQRTWSGTPYSLYHQLSQLYELNDYDLYDKKRRIFFCTLKKVLNIRSSEIFELEMMKENQERFFIDHPTCDMPILQFNECISSPKYITYIYQDLCIAFLLYLHDNEPELFIKSGFDCVPIKTIKQRAILQNEYYRTSCKGIFVMGDWLREFMINKCGISPELVHCVGGGVNVDVEKIDYSKKTGKRILFVGIDFERKAGKLVCEAFKVFRDNYMSDAQLYIIGPKKRYKCMESDGINYIGRCDYDGIVDYYNLCDILCVPSYFEAYGLVFPEALCFGLPCIGRNAFAMREIIKDGENGYLIDSDDINILADKMYYLLSNETIIKNVQENREYYINKYSWSSVAMRISEFIY